MALKAVEKKRAKSIWGYMIAIDSFSVKSMAKHILRRQAVRFGHLSRLSQHLVDEEDILEGE